MGYRIRRTWMVPSMESDLLQLCPWSWPQGVYEKNENRTYLTGCLREVRKEVRLASDTWKLNEPELPALLLHRIRPAGHDGRVCLLRLTKWWGHRLGDYK